MKWISTPSISVVNCGSAFRRSSIAPEVVVVRPVVRERLERRQLDALRAVVDELLRRPARRSDAPAQIVDLLIRNVDAEVGGGLDGGAHGGLLQRSVVDAARSSLMNFLGSCQLSATSPGPWLWPLARIYASIGAGGSSHWEDGVESSRGEHDGAAVDATAGRDAGAGLLPRRDAGPEGLTLRLPRAADDPRLLPGGLEPGLLRPAGALPGAAAGVPALRRPAAGHLGRRHLVAPRLREGPQPPLPAARRLRAQRRGRADVRRLPAAGRHRASAPCS